MEAGGRSRKVQEEVKLPSRQFHYRRLPPVCQRLATIQVLQVVPAAPSSGLLPQLLPLHQQERLREFSPLQALGCANRGKGNLSKFFIVPNFLLLLLLLLNKF